MGARVALATVRDVLAAGGTSVERVTFVVFAADSYEAFERVIDPRPRRRRQQLSDV